MRFYAAPTELRAVSRPGISVLRGCMLCVSMPPQQSFVQSHADGTKDGRMVHALSETGSAVFVGGMTALSGGREEQKAANRRLGA